MLGDEPGGVVAGFEGVELLIELSNGGEGFKPQELLF